MRISLGLAKKEKTESFVWRNSELPMLQDSPMLRNPLPVKRKTRTPPPVEQTKPQKTELSKKVRQYETAGADKQEQARFRYDMVKLWERFREERKTYSEFREYVKALHGTDIPYGTLNQWRKAVSADPVLGALDKRGRKRGDCCKMDKWIREYLETMFLDSLGNIRPMHLWKSLHAQAYHDGKFKNFKNIMNSTRAKKQYGSDWQLIDRTSVSRYLKFLREKHAEYIRYHNNPDGYDALREPAYGNMDENVFYPNQIWEADASPFDMMTLRIDKDGDPKQYRYKLIALTDVYSRMTVVDIVERTDTLAVARILWRAFVTLGIPRMIRFDWGKEFIAKSVRESLTHIGVTPVNCEPFKGRQKPYVERFFGTLQHSFTEMSEGYLGHNLKKRAEIESRVRKSERLKGVKTNLPDLKMIDEVRDELADWMSYVYSNTEHSGIGMSPAERYRHGIAAHPPEQIADDQLHYVLGERIRGRNITKKGIQDRHILYQSPELTRFCGRKADIVIDMNNVRKAYAYDSETGEFLCVLRSEGESMTAEERKQALKTYHQRLREFERTRKFAKANCGQFGNMTSTIIDAAKKEYTDAFDGTTILTEYDHTVSEEDENEKYYQQYSSPRSASLKEIQKQAESDELRNEINKAVPDITQIRKLAREENQEEKKPMTLKGMMGI